MTTNPEIQIKLSKLPPGLSKLNVESWHQITFFFEEFSERDSWGWLEPMYQLAKQIANSEQAQLFRAGQSLYYLMISTAEKHGLGKDEPFVSLQLDENQPFLIQYWECYGKSKKSQTCQSAEEAINILQPFLDQLWNATRD